MLPVMSPMAAGARETWEPASSIRDSTVRMGIFPVERQYRGESVNDRSYLRIFGFINSYYSANIHNTYNVSSLPRDAGMEKIRVYKARSFSDGEEFDRNYYSEMSGSERLEVVQMLREEYVKINSGKVYGKSRKGLRKVLTIIDQ